jgi:hypothetical protein
MVTGEISEATPIFTVGLPTMGAQIRKLPCHARPGLGGSPSIEVCARGEGGNHPLENNKLSIECVAGMIGSP